MHDMRIDAGQPIMKKKPISLRAESKKPATLSAVKGHFCSWRGLDEFPKHLVKTREHAVRLTRLALPEEARRTTG